VRRRKKRKKVKISRLTRISFLPSVFTIFNLFLGYMALIQILNRNYLNAAYLITLSVVMDGFDGTIARLTKTESNFGMHLDSLVDGVTFGLVTSIFIFKWGFQTVHPPLGKIIGFIFLSAGIIRLARFNVYKEVKAFPANIFIGIPIPLASLSIISVFLIVKTSPAEVLHMVLFAAFVILVAFLMISNVKYRTMKRINPKYSLVVLFVLAVLIASAIMYPAVTIPFCSFLYLVSPIFVGFFNKLKKSKVKASVAPQLEPNNESQ
jgi:CDP-diacylglycerol--serine O-phosphatidyltransferase